MKTLFLFFIFIVSKCAIAQQPGWSWAKRIGGTGEDGAQNIAADSSGNLFATGSYNGTVDFDPDTGVFNLIPILQSDIFIAKLSIDGNLIWAKSIGGYGPDYATYIVLDPGSGSIYITGYFYGTVDFDPDTGVYNLTAASTAYQDIFICKLDSSGNFIWAKSFGGISADNASGLAFSNAEDAVYVTGVFQQAADFDPGPGAYYLQSNGITDVFILKLNGAGDFVWVKQFGGGLYDLGSAITLDSIGNVYTTGAFAGSVDFDPGPGTYYLSSNSQSGDIFVSKLDSSGNFGWAKSMGGANTDLGYFITCTNTGNPDIYVTGVFLTTCDFDPDTGVLNLVSAGSYDTYVAKLNFDGHLIWAKRIGAGSQDYGYSLTLTPDNRNLFLVGYFNNTVDFDPDTGVYMRTSAGGTDMFISSYDSAGLFNWAKNMGGTVDDVGRAITINPLGGLFFSGEFGSAAIQFDTCLLVNAGINSYDMCIARLDTAISTQINQQEDFSNEFMLFPNPASDYFSISTSQSAIEKIEIYNLIGENVFVHLQSIPFHTIKEISVDISYLAASIYFVKITTGNCSVVIKLLIQ
jgi:hypothetical protein